MKLGTRTHDYGRYSVEELPKFLKSEGFNSSQLVLARGLTEIDSYDKITDDLLDKVKVSFEKNGIEIGVLGCYMDFGNPDQEVRDKAIETFKKLLHCGKKLGAVVVGTETAYPRLNKKEKEIWYPYMIDSLEKIIKEAEKIDQNIGLEPVYWHPLENLEVTIDIFKKFNSKNLRMIFDPANVLEFPEIDQSAHWKTWFEALGDKIDILHMKDFVLGENREYIPIELGKGVMDYTEIIKWLKANKPDITIIREELNPKTSTEDVEYMNKLWNE